MFLCLLLLNLSTDWWNIKIIWGKRGETISVELYPFKDKRAIKGYYQINYMMSTRQLTLSPRHEVLAEDEFENECSGEERVLSPPISKDRYRTRMFLARKISCDFQFNCRRSCSSTFYFQL